MLAAFLLLFAASAFSGQYDAYDPKALIARAMELATAGQADSARILLARAERIVPGDARVARARQAIEAHVAGSALASEPAASRPAALGAAPVPRAIPDAPPPAWRVP